MSESYKVIGTPVLTRRKPRFGDHVEYQRCYVGLIVDVFDDSDSCMVACRTGKIYRESAFRMSQLKTVAARR